MRLVITGGHISPALSIIENLPFDWEVFFVGRKSSFEGDSGPSLEYQVIKALGIPFVNLPSARLQRKFTIHTIPSLAKLPYGIVCSIAILKKIKPDAVLGFGGYISFPICLAARFLSIPVVIHEQTLEAGAANKIISKWAKVVCVSWNSSRDFFPGRNIILTGNPIRKEIFKQVVDSKSSKKQTIYVTGGSAGSHFINSLVGQCLEKLLKDYVIIHQTGDSRKYNDYEKLKTAKKELPKNLSDKYFLKKFTDSQEIRAVLDNASLVVGRSGINTVTELIYLNKPCLLIPISNSAADEQFKNALFIKNLGLAEVLRQEEATASSFVSTIKKMLGNITNYKLAGGNENLIEKKAAEHIISVVKDVAKKE